MSSDTIILVKRLLAKLMNVEPEKIDDTAEIANMPGIDSLIMLQFIVKIEQEFNVRCDMTFMEDAFYSVETISNFINKSSKQ